MSDLPTWTSADWQAHFHERAGILEYDQGMARADAERQALQEICDQRLADGHPGIVGELARADRRRMHPDIAPVLADDALANVRGPAWGLGHAVADGETYRPALDGEPAHAAVIVPAVEDGAVTDLVACTLVQPRRMRSRLGVAALVGLDEVQRVRDTGSPLLVFEDTIRWLRGNTRGAVLVDWERAIREIEGLPILMCCASLAPRLYSATCHCRPRPTIAMPARKDVRHAA